MNLFFSSIVQGNEILLADQEAQHCGRVLRKQVGDLINILDGKGYLFHARISEISKKEVRAIILNHYHEAPNPSYPHIAFGLIKNPNRIEWMIEKIVEIGVASITPIVTKHSERQKLKEERIEKIILSAVKQSKKLYLPTFHPVKSFSEYIDQCQKKEPLFIANYREGQTELRSVTPAISPILIIGPEGDFSSEELTLAEKNGFRAVNLGTSRLRAETAVVVATSFCSIP